MKLSQINFTATVKIKTIEECKYKHNLINMGLHRNTVIFIEDRVNDKNYVSFLLFGVEYVLKRKAADYIEVIVNES